MADKSRRDEKGNLPNGAKTVSGKQFMQGSFKGGNPLSTLQKSSGTTAVYKSNKGSK